MPNFIVVDFQLSKNVYNHSTTIPVSELSIDEAERYGEQMKQAFIDHCNSKRAKESSPLLRNR